MPYLGLHGNLSIINICPVLMEIQLIRFSHHGDDSIFLPKTLSSQYTIYINVRYAMVYYESDGTKCKQFFNNHDQCFHTNLIHQN